MSEHDHHGMKKKVTLFFYEHSFQFFYFSVLLFFFPVHMGKKKCITCQLIDFLFTVVFQFGIRRSSGKSLTNLNKNYESQAWIHRGVKREGVNGYSYPSSPQKAKKKL
jgi:hypothetical protein